MILILMFLVSCTTQNETQKKEFKIPEFSSFVINSNSDNIKVKQMPIIKTVTIRAVDQGFSPDTIIVNQGDIVGLYITNTRTQNVETVNIVDHSIEDFYHSGNTIYLEFTANTKGEFDFGDDRANSQKGKIIVR